MDVDALRYFLAVIEARSMRGAAEDLHIAQSALSRQIGNLEKELGVSLLVRLPRGVKPTEAGKMLARRARSALDQLARARDDITSLSGLTTGKVAVSAIEPVAEGLLMDAMQRMQQAHPAISFDIRVGNSAKVITLLREGIVELAVAYNAPHDRDIVVRSESHVPLVALVEENHPLTKHNRVASKAGFGARTCTLKDLAPWPLVLPPAGSPTRTLIDEAVRRAVLPLLQIALESDSVPVRLAFLKQAKAVAIMADMSGRMARPGYRVATITIDDDILASGSLQLLANRDHQLSPAASAFERLLRSSMRSLRGER
ncbi:LysR family transcriptional regulator [Agrobacterium salinitolerans]|uniref:HTH-type transcriptional regulator TtuA n=1 Tax=Agrobacterium salinitolerans TaxID=1183413 RepID=A0A9X3KUQ4_9HYPH|nr:MULTISPECIES: LysR family transcriptional regulator [Agrobacterium]MCZ7854964.1 LysR family transcriptional regulator [Agrobacterium salinitolerans]MCZ7894789.1 LysR family transcriptional regulator [Agrobacterium salinitolerans]MCZ7940678.1 LysR family transcriptional regulator [Agrobacterium salinitolerans]TRA83173.1 LysR family transcriptional regulator [Agrobacterium salinitolerans]